jgi:hypothetical protein
MAKRGVHLSEAHKNSIREKLKGVPKSYEHRLKVIQNVIDFRFKKGHTPWNKGKTGIYSEETLQKNKEKHLGKLATTATKLKMSLRLAKLHPKGMLGKYHTEEWKKNHKEFMLKHPEIVKKSLKRRTPSSLELKMIKIIEKLNLPYKFVGDGKLFIERKNPDFINCNGEKIAVEVFYRKHKNQFRGNNTWKDVEEWKQQRLEIFSKYGWGIEFFDETQVNEEEVQGRLG